MANVKDLAITSTDFEPGARLPDRLAAERGNERPEFSVSGVPEGTVELALIVHDPDAPIPLGFTHLVVYGLPARDGALDVDAGRVGPNTLGEAAWYGMKPPPGHGQHHYYCWVYALSAKVEGEPTREDFLGSYADAIIEQNRVVGTYSS